MHCSGWSLHILKILVVILFVLGAGSSAWWWVARHTLEQTIETWAAEGRKNGATVDLGKVESRGFPVRVQTSVGPVAVTWPNGIRWQGDGLMFDAPVWRGNAMHLRLTAPQKFYLPVDDWEALDAIIDSGEASITLGGDGGFTKAHITLADVSVQPLATLDRVDVSVSQPARKTTRKTETGLRVSVSLAGLDLPGLSTEPLGSYIELLTITAQVKGGPPGLEPGKLAAWRQDGGTLELDTAGLHWGPTVLDLQGTLVLDHELQPDGVLTGQLSGFDPAIDFLVESYWIKPDKTESAKNMLSNMVPHPEGAPAPPDAPARLPLSIRERTLYLGAVPLTRVRKFVW